MLPVLQAAVRRAAELGIPIAAGADTSYSESAVTSVATEVQYLHDAGLSPLDALRAATMNPARMLGVDKEVGSLAAGKYADLIAIDGNPAQDIATLRTIKFVMKGGQIVRDEVTQ
jgi:imidazolonepropionase-like amidohydrolase